MRLIDCNRVIIDGRSRENKGRDKDSPLRQHVRKKLSRTSHAARRGKWLALCRDFTAIETGGERKYYSARQRKRRGPLGSSGTVMHSTVPNSAQQMKGPLARNRGRQDICMRRTYVGDWFPTSAATQNPNRRYVVQRKSGTAKRFSSRKRKSWPKRKKWPGKGSKRN